ncbi:MAG: hypothetical protein ISR50_02470 [Alphaproteobacteria bacterium]|nr:hypothetical protein [Alphaproteobacteria bacterium]MBL6951468.1 hypothetical protein [Alphaproteobacteria bacterium]
MAFWADIDHDYTLRFQEWHNCEHIPERISIPGFNVGRRYRGIAGAPKFLMFYETDTAAVFASEAYMARLNDPTPWTQESLPHFGNPSRNIYSLEAAAGSVAPIEAPYVHTFRFNLAEGADIFAWLAKLADRDDVYRARLYAVDEDISNIMTSERQIYGGGPGAQKYLVLLETTLQCRTLDELAMPPGAKNMFADSFRLEIALYPEA